MSHLSFVKTRLDLRIISTKPFGLSVLAQLQETLNNLKFLREHQFCLVVPKILTVSIATWPSISKPKPEPVLPEFTPSTKIEAPTHYKRSSTISTTYNSELTLPYKILWAKVIVRAAYDYALWKNSDDIRLRRFADDAARWLFDSPDPDLELSFENICFAFDFPVEKIRKKTRTLTREDVKKLEFRERQGRSEILGEISDGDGK